MTLKLPSWLGGSNNQAKVTCPTCNGCGYVIEELYLGSTKMFSQKKTCGTCKGAQTIRQDGFV